MSGSPTELTSAEVKSKLKKFQHLVADASMVALVRKADGVAYFLTDGNDIPATKVSAQYLRNTKVCNEKRRQKIAAPSPQTLPRKYTTTTRRGT
jgi:hypothetical protein